MSRNGSALLRRGAHVRALAVRYFYRMDSRNAAPARARLPNAFALGLAAAVMASGLLLAGSSAAELPSSSLPPASLARANDVGAQFRAANVWELSSESAQSSGAKSVVRAPRDSAASPKYTFTWPSDGAISQGMSPVHPTGIDIRAVLGEPMRAVRDGKVSFAGGDPCCVYGYYVVIEHDDGWSSLYGHLSEIDVAVGDEVRQGDVLGLAGDTGKATGVHLHFELHKDGYPVNPLDYLEPLRSYVAPPIDYTSVGGQAPPAEEETDTPPEPEPTNAGVAIDAAARWMISRVDDGYTIDRTSCFAVEFGPNWSVNCATALVGCGGSDYCEPSFMEACVMGESLLVEAVCTGY